MTLLLDTHVLLWWAGDDPRLGTATRAAIASDALVAVSAVSAWEIAIKQALGRLTAPPLRELLAAEGFRELPLTVDHALEAGGLPDVHRDPFDRALVAQARVEGLVLVSADPKLSGYDVSLLDAAR